jgi:hypothetical protein
VKHFEESLRSKNSRLTKISLTWTITVKTHSSEQAEQLTKILNTAEKSHHAREYYFVLIP